MSLLANVYLLYTYYIFEHVLINLIFIVIFDIQWSQRVWNNLPIENKVNQKARTYTQV